jgi:DnaK suppressor protein
MDKRNLDRYKRLLLEKRSEISIARAEAESPVPAAGGWEGDQIDQANADAEAELQIHLHQTNLRLLRAIEGALARIRNGTFGTCESCQNPISRARLESCTLGATLSQLQRPRTWVRREVVEPPNLEVSYCRKDRFDRR